MKIVLMGESIRMPTGFGTQLGYLAHGFAQMGHDVHVFGANANARLRGDGIKEYKVQFGDWKLAEKLCSQINPDALIALAISQWVMGIHRAPDMLRNIPCFLWMAFEPVSVPEDYGNQIALIGDRVVHLTHFHDRLWRDYLGSRPVVYHGIDTNVFRPLARPGKHESLKRDLRRKWSKRFDTPLGKEDKILLCVDRNATRKRHDLLFDAVARIQRTYPDVRLLMHCKRHGGRFGFDLEALAKAYGIQDSVVFTGFEFHDGLKASEVNELYNLADCRVCCTGGEGFGVPDIEAIAAGCPSVVPQGSTHDELDAPYRYLARVSGRSCLYGNFLFDVVDTESFTRKVRDALSFDRETAIEIAHEKGNEYSTEKMLKAWLQLIRNVDLRTHKLQWRYRGVTGQKDQARGRYMAHAAVNLADGGNVLEYKCGPGYISGEVLASRGNPIPFDVTAETITVLPYALRPMFVTCAVQDFGGKEVSVVVANQTFAQTRDDELETFLANVNPSWLVVYDERLPYTCDTDRIVERTPDEWEKWLADRGYNRREEIEAMIAESAENTEYPFFVYSGPRLDTADIPRKVLEGVA